MGKLIIAVLLIFSSCGDILNRQKHIKGPYYLVKDESGFFSIGYKDSGGFIQRTPGNLQKYWICDSSLIAKVSENSKLNYYVINFEGDYTYAQEYEYRLGPFSPDQLKTNPRYSKCFSDIHVVAEARDKD